MKLKNIFGMIASGGLAIVGASSLFSVAHAETLGSAVGVATGAGGVEGLGGAAVVGILAWLLQQSTRERVTEAKEFGEAQKQMMQSHADAQKQMHADHMKLVLDLMFSKQR